ncbi:hypothetical protein BKA69DRAFT_1124429 [Paraphysoderma sedebokerense]|nr:hypothetical protein BKA69DRAFT_1124429 [Paraphysoderma sedebokerense]
MAIFSKNQVKDTSDLEATSTSEKQLPVEGVKSIHHQVLQTVRARRILPFTSVVIIIHVVAFLITHFLIIPAAMKSKFASAPFHLYPDSLSITFNANNSMSFHFKGEVFMERLPTTISIAAGSYSMVSKVSGKPIISEIYIPELQLSADKRKEIEFSSYLNVGDLESLSSIITGMSKDALSSETAELEVSTSELSIKLFGFWLPATRVTRTMSIAGLTSQKFLDALVYARPLYLPEKEDPTLIESPRPERKFTPAKIDKLTVKNVQRTGTSYKEFTFDTEISGVNPTPFVGPLEVAFNMKTKNNRQVKVRSQNLILTEPFQNATARPSFQVTLPENYEGLHSSIDDVITDILSAKSVLIPTHITGPIEVYTENKKIEWVSQATGGLVVPVKISL